MRKVLIALSALASLAFILGSCDFFFSNMKPRYTISINLDAGNLSKAGSSAGRAVTTATPLPKFSGMMFELGNASGDEIMESFLPLINNTSATIEINDISSVKSIFIEALLDESAPENAEFPLIEGFIGNGELPNYNGGNTDIAVSIKLDPRPHFKELNDPGEITTIMRDLHPDFRGDNALNLTLDFNLSDETSFTPLPAGQAVDFTVSAVDYYSFSDNAHSIWAAYSNANVSFQRKYAYGSEYIINEFTAVPPGGGTVSAKISTGTNKFNIQDAASNAPTKLWQSDQIEVTVRPATGYSYIADSLKYITSAGTEVSIPASQTDTDFIGYFSMPNDSVRISAEFEIIPAS